MTPAEKIKIEAFEGITGGAVHPFSQSRVGWAIAVFIALLAVATLGTAVAAGSCTTGCIDVHGMGIHETSVNNTQTYPVAATKTKAGVDDCLDRYENEQLCEKGGQLTCQESLEYPQMRYFTHRYGDAPDRNLTQINAYVAAMAKAHICSPDSASVTFLAKRIYALGTLLSLVLFDLDYLHSAGGSCHGRFLTMTFDTRHGAKPIPLSAAISMKDYAALRKVLLRELKAQNPNAFSTYSPTNRQQAWQRALREADHYLRDKAPATWTTAKFISTLGSSYSTALTGTFMDYPYRTVS